MAGVLFVGAMLVLGVGCESMEESVSLKKPTARLMGMQFKDADAYGATVVFDVQIVNHYSAELPLRRFSYAVSSQGQRFMAGTAALAMRIPFAGSETVSLPARIDYPDTLRRLGGARPGATIPYEAQVDLVIETPRLGPITLLLDKTGEVALPQVSDADLEKLLGGTKSE
ncbi:MAG: LEA type 2 family protein [Phycisphaerales bacterium]